MSDEDADWQRLIDGLRAGDPRIEREFWDLHGAALHRLADRHLAGRLRARVEADDVVLSAYRTFLRRARVGEFQLPDSNSLWRLLCVITLTKVREQARFHMRQKRGLDQEVPLSPGPDSSGGGLEPADPNPTPADAAAFADQMQHLLGSLDEEERQIVEVKLEDLTNDEVAQRLGCSERTVRRILKRIESRLRHLLGESE